MTTKFRIGVIGSGGISNNPIHGYFESGRYTIVALAERMTSDEEVTTR